MTLFEKQRAVSYIVSLQPLERDRLLIWFLHDLSAIARSCEHVFPSQESQTAFLRSFSGVVHAVAAIAMQYGGEDSGADRTKHTLNLILSRDDHSEPNVLTVIQNSLITVLTQHADLKSRDGL